MTEQTAVATKPKLEDQIQVWDAEGGKVELSVALVRMYFCPLATTVEAMTFLNICKFQKLNPWLREVYLVKYSDKYPASIVVGKDTFTKRAERNPKFRGLTAGIIVGKKATDIIERRTGMFYRKDKEDLLGGWATVPRGEGELPVEIEVPFDEYVGRTGDGSLNKQWSSKPATMIRKVALVQALRERFPEEFQGMYDEAEILPQEKRPEDFLMPLSVDEAKAKTNAEMAEKHDGEEVQVEPYGAVDAVPMEADATLETEARAREQAEAATEIPPGAPKPKVDRSAIWNAVLRKAKEEKKSAGAVLKEYTAKHNMTDLSDLECADLAKKLGV